MFWFFLISTMTYFLSNNGYVTCNLQGQLGNQMFQIATAVAYGLDHRCRVTFPGLDQVMDGYRNEKYIFRHIDTTPAPEQNPTIYRENQHTHYTIYSEIPFEKGQQLCLDGFFQTPKYFEHHADHIRQLFACSPKIKKQIYAKYGELLKTPTVALHIRTFIPDKRDPNQSIGQRGWKYFQEAMSHFSDEYTFLVFSDDIKWVKENFPETDRKIVFIEGNPHWFDFYLMSFCDHQIISFESTFSWWAAWMNNKPGKKVIAPHTWASRLDAEIIPSDWIKITLENP